VKKKYLFGYLIILAASNTLGNTCYKESLFDKKELINDDSLVIEADSSSVDNKNIFNLFGDASVVSSKYAINADKIIINKNSKQAFSSGNVRFNDELLLLKAESLDITKKDNDNFIEVINSEYSIPGQKIRGKAMAISGNSNQKFFKKATYTKCPTGNENWIINAENIQLNALTNRGKAENAILKLHGLPVLYHPSIDWVLSGKGSGFLAPSFSSYSDESSAKDGYSIRIPYFLNIAPDRDLLIGLNYLSTRGTSIDSEYRQLIYDSSLWDSGKLETNFKYLDNDDVTGKDRWYLNNKIDLSLNQNSSLKLINNRVSDTNYFKEISLEGTSVERLTSSLNLAHDSKFITAHFYSENEQLVNSGVADYTRKYDLGFSKNLNLIDGVEMKISGASTDFDHRNTSSTTGNRNHFQTSLSKKYKNIAYEIQPSLSILTTNYDLDNSSKLNRSLYKTSLEGKLFLERELNFADKDYIQTLTPIFKYSYIPKDNQNSIPNFDSDSLASSYESLFNGSLYTGLDKISNQDSLTVGLESEFIDDESGNTLLVLKAAQKYYFEDELLNSSGNFASTSDSNRGYTNIETFIEYGSGKFKLNNSLSFNPDNSKIDKSSSGLKVNFSPESFANLRFIDENSEENIQLNGSYQVNDANNLFWNFQRNLTSGTTDRLTLGVSNEDCCVAYRFGFFKKNIGDNKYSYDKSFEIVFKGLSSTTPSLQARIKSEIPDYIGDIYE